MNNIPQELLDAILSNLPPDDRSFFPTLRSCSLVSKSWLEPSRRLLFANVTITPSNYPRWLESISPTNTEILRHVRWLVFSAPWFDPISPDNNIDVPREYLPSLPQLRALSFYGVDIEHIIPEHLDSFSPFQHTLSSLSLSSLSFTWNAFVTFIGYFPNLVGLRVIRLSFKLDSHPAPRLARALRGRLYVDLLDADADIFTDQFSRLSLKYEEISIPWEFGPRLLTAVQDNLKYLNLFRCIPNLDLSHCPQLRQLEIYGRDSELQTTMLISLITSITSTNLQKLVLMTFQLSQLLLEPYWTDFDDKMCGFVDKLRTLGHTHTLELEFLMTRVDVDKKLHPKFLPKFREKGTVTIRLDSRVSRLVGME